MVVLDHLVDLGLVGEGDPSPKLESTLRECDRPEDAADSDRVLDVCEVREPKRKQVFQGLPVVSTNPFRKRRVGLPVSLHLDGRDQRVNVPIASREGRTDANEVRHRRVGGLAHLALVLIHEDQLARYRGGAGIRDRGLLESAVAVARASAGGAFAHEDLFAMAAAYAFHIAQNPP